MASRTILTTLIIRNDTAANWQAANPTLAKGEMGIENDTSKFKFGDGSTAWNSLGYASSSNFAIKTTNPAAADDGYDLGTIWVNSTAKTAFIMVDNTTGAAVWNVVGDMSKSVFATNSKVSSGYVDSAIAADALSTARTISVSGDATGSASFDGSANADIAITFATTGVTAGTYPKVTVNAKGLVTAGESLVTSDIPDLTLAKITDAGTAAAADTGTSSGNVPVLDANGKLDTSVLPAIAITDTFTVDSEAEMLALTAQKGDVAIRTDLSKTFILTDDDPSVLANWKELATPTDAVSSVNGKTGVVVLSTTDISEGTNLYYTDDRFDTRFATKIAETSVADLSDGANVLMSTDTFTINGGSASNS